MEYQPISNRVFVTVTSKTPTFQIPFMNRVMMHMQGDMTDLANVVKELNHIKMWVNQELNRNGAALKNYDIQIEQLKGD